ncbi:MAG: hypothetical protein MUP81_02585 [Dehalococcoidia bacterium]|nr:hypothetical protein [Dehalococcoidia bacterium]
MKQKDKMVVVGFHCDLALKQELEHHAKKLGWKRNFLIRECLRSYMAMTDYEKEKMFSHRGT